MDEHKRCRKCGVSKPRFEFSKKASAKDGLQPVCKACACRITGEYAERNKARAIVLMPDSKRCPRCDTDKPAREFSKKASNKDGLQSRCKACMTAFLATYYDANAEKMKAGHAAYYVANKAAHNAATKAYAKKNKERLAELARLRYQATSEKRKAAAAARYAEKGEEIRTAQIARNAANPERRREIDGRIRAKRMAAPGSHTAADIKALMKLQRGLCIGCRCDIRKLFHVDHIEALTKGGSNDRINLQLLCPTCNKSKHARHSVDFMKTKGFLL